MLNLESRMEILGITVFQDTDRASQFYYLPGSPKISVDRGVPQFDLFAYRKSGEAGQTMSGGFLNMTVDVGIGGLKDRIEARLKEQFGDEATLAPVPLTKGEARVIALGEDSRALQGGVENETAPNGQPLVARGPRFIQNILGPGHPSLDGDNRCVFSFSLSEEGTAFFLNILNGSVNARPIGVVYELEYVGLLPAYDLEVTIDFRSCYEYMRTRFTLGTLFFRADVDNIVEELKRRESIKIKETARTLELSTPEAIRERQNRIDQLVKDLASGAMFQPSLVPGEPRVREQTITAADPTTAIPAAGSVSSASDALRYGPSPAVAVGMGAALERRPTEGGATPPGGATPAGGTTPPGGATTPGGTTPAGGATPTGGGSSTPTAADVWNQLGRPQAAFALRNIRQEEQRTVTYSLSQTTAQKRTVSPQSFIQFLANPREIAQHVHSVDLNHPFFQRLNLNVNVADVDFAAQGVTQILVQLRYGKRPDGTGPKDTAEALFRAKGELRDFTFFTDRNQTQWYEYKLVVDYRHDFGIGVKDTRIESDWIRTETRSLSVSPNWLGKTLPVTLQLDPNTPPELREAQVRVRYVNAPRNIDDSTLVRLLPSGQPQTVFIRLADASEQFEVSRRLFYSDGTSEELPVLHLPDPNTGESDEYIIISTPRANRLDGDIIMQDSLGELQTVLVDRQITQADELVDSQTIEMATPGQRSAFSIRLPHRDKPATMRYRERRIYKDSGVESDEWREALSPNLIVGIPSEGVLPVKIRYQGVPISGLGLSAILLDLEYKDPQGDARFTQTASKLIDDDPSSHIQEWKIRLVDRAVRSYQWRLTLLFADGTDRSTDWKTETRDLLLIRSPQL
jgi:hypothetical protein